MSLYDFSCFSRINSVILQQKENSMIVYHGTNMVIEHPEIQVSGFYKDFGFGFYCTMLERQAWRWAVNKLPKHVVNLYNYTENARLKTLQFDEMTEEWLDFVISCRQGMVPAYDIVDGPMADDTIWNYIEDFLAGAITREAFWVLAKFKYPTHQILFCTQEALSALTYERSYEL